MADIAIRVENVSKCYRLGLIGGHTLHDDFERWWAKVRGKPDPLLKACPECKRRIGQEDYANRQGEYIRSLRSVQVWALRNDAASVDEVPVTIIKPSKGWVSLKLGDLWEYRELLYFLTVLVSALVAVGLLVSGAYYFRRMEKTFADVV